MDFTLTDITSLIEACRKQGVRSFKYLGVELEFDAAPVAIIGEPAPVAESEADIKEAELKLREEQLELLKLEDPYTYEQLINFDRGA